MHFTNNKFIPKQILLDLLIVVVLPIAIVIGYFYFTSDGGKNLLSSVSSATTPLPGENASELGATTKAALTELKSISFDKTIFTDPTFLSLEDFTLPIVASPIGREYPFTQTSELRVMSARKVNTSAKPSPVGSIKIPVNADISQKLDAVKGGVK